jgi:hypothetical protein
MVTFMKNADLEKLLETSNLYFLLECYDWIVTTRMSISSNVISTHLTTAVIPLTFAQAISLYESPQTKLQGH